MTADTLRDLIARGVDRAEAARVVDGLRDLARDELFARLHAAGVECIRHHDSRAYLARRLFLSLTARVRLAERTEC